MLLSNEKLDELGIIVKNIYSLIHNIKSFQQIDIITAQRSKP